MSRPNTEQQPAPRPTTGPVLPGPVAAPDAQAWARVQHFFLLQEHEGLEPPPEGALPALLGSFRDPTALRTDYPLMLSVDGDGAPAVQGFEQAVNEALGGRSSRLLGDNLPRLHHLCQQQIVQAAPVQAQDVLRQAGAKMLKALDLSSPHDDSLRAEVEALAKSLPGSAQFLGLSAQTPVHLGVHVATHQTRRHRQALMARVKTAHSRITDLLHAERQKDEGATAPDTIKIGMGPVGASLLNPMALSQVLGAHRGAQKMAPERRQRLQTAHDTLQSWLTSSDPTCVLLHDGLLDDLTPAALIATELESVPSPAEAAVQRFEAQASAWAPRFVALRVAELELKGAWDEAEHGPWLRGLTWAGLSPQELLCLPPVVAVVPGAEAANDGLLATSRALASGRPVKILALVHPAQDPRAAQAEGYRLELAYLGMSHRQAYVLQSSAARPEHLTGGLQAGLGAARAGLFLVSQAQDSLAEAFAVGPWLAASAAIEARAHPLLTYAPDAGSTWRKRLSLDGNPQASAGWPNNALACQALSGAPETLQLRFTFADYALLDHGLAQHFRTVPQDCATEGLMPIDAWLQLDEAESDRKVPFIWAEDAAHQLHRLVISRSMAWLCRDRLSYWTTLQEFGGLNNEHVRVATQQVSAEAEAELKQALEAQAAQHAQALEAVRAGAAREAMQRLTAVLLDTEAGPLGVTAPPATASAPVTPPPSATPPATETAPAPTPKPAVVEQEEEDEDEEPWVDSALCTSCNDCVIINPRLFVYDDNKQVVVGDPKAGSFAEIVKAAEGCPSKCIHPGSPLDPSEPDLEALRERARRFN